MYYLHNTCMCEYVYVSVCVCVNVCVCVCVCLCVHACIFFDHFLSVFPCNYVLVSVCIPAYIDECISTHIHACVHCSDYIRIIMESYHHLARPRASAYISGNALVPMLQLLNILAYNVYIVTQVYQHIIKQSWYKEFARIKPVTIEDLPIEYHRTGFNF